MIKPQAETKDIQLDMAIPSVFPTLRADTRQLKQIIINLLSNAIKFTGETGKVHIASKKNADGSISVIVEDTGIGIAPGNIAKITEPFGQIRSDSSQTHAGTGLGLSLSKRMTELYGGTLSIKSDLGKGTAITIRFPADRITAIH